MTLSASVNFVRGFSSARGCCRLPVLYTARRLWSATDPRLSLAGHVLTGVLSSDMAEYGTPSVNSSVKVGYYMRERERGREREREGGRGRGRGREGETGRWYPLARNTTFSIRTLFSLRLHHSIYDMARFSVELLQGEQCFIVNSGWFAKASPAIYGNGRLIFSTDAYRCFTKRVSLATRVKLTCPFTPMSSIFSGRMIHSFPAMVNSTWTPVETK